MAETVVSPYGTWRSPVQASDLVEGALGLGYPVPRPNGGGLIWEESRPAEGGRVALVAADAHGGGVTELLPPGMSARTIAHEYGGRAWAAGGPGGRLLVSSNFTDQRLWDVSPGQAPRPLTPEAPQQRSVRFACPAISPDGAWAVAVRERHLADEVVNDIVAVATAGELTEPWSLAGGHDFYAAPTFSPDGRHLAFICWDHPNMPWDRTELWRAEFANGGLSGLSPVAGQGADDAVLQPLWAPDGDLYYISDRTGWWNLFRGETNLAPVEAEFAGPAWTFGGSDYVLLPDGTIVAVWRSGGRAFLGTVAGGGVNALDLPYTSFSHLSADVRGANAGVLAVAGSPTRAFEIVRISTDGGVEVLKRSRVATGGEDWISAGEPFSFGTGNGEVAHAFYYPPVNPGFRAPAAEKPPLIVTSHGGPTGNASSVLALGTQYWTTRGFAVVDVDYRGSAGYGRAYRQALDGAWGLADVEDCAGAARWLAGSGRVDPARMVTRGGSASGLTVLADLARYRDFAAGVVRYPVVDLVAMASDTHKFESRYMERLVPPSEAEGRSPLAMAGRIAAPVLFLHGLDDKVVPPDQSRQMVAALRRAGTEALLVEIEGESHGFRRASTTVRAQEAELAFVGAVLGFGPDGDLSRARADLAAAAAPGGTTWAGDEPAGA